MTVRSVFEKLQQSGPLSRADLTRETGISAPTVSKVVSELIELGLVEETSVSENLLGRPGKQLSIARIGSRVVGVTFNQSETMVLSATLDGQSDLQQFRTIATGTDYSGWLAELSQAIRAICESQTIRIQGVGICVPGVTRCPDDQTPEAITGRFPEEKRLTEDLKAATGLHCVAVRQGQALAMAERLFGDARWLDDFVMLDVSSEPFAGVYCDGELVAGKNGLAGPFNMLQGNYPCREPGDPDRFDSDSQFVEAVSRRLGQSLTLDSIWQAYSSNEQMLESELERFCESLATSVAAFINFFDPSTVFVYSRVLGFSQGLLEKVIERARGMSLMSHFEGCQIKSASVRPQQASIAAVIESLNRQLGPRLVSPGPFLATR